MDSTPEQTASLMNGNDLKSDDGKDSCRPVFVAAAIVLIVFLVVVGLLVGLYLTRSKQIASMRHQRKPGQRPGAPPSAPSSVPASTQQAAASLLAQEQMAKYAALSSGSAPPTSHNSAAATKPMGGPSGMSAASLTEALYRGAPYGAGSTAGVAPMGVAGMGQFASVGNNTSPFNDSYPNNDVGLTEASNDPWSGSNLTLSKLMPSSWRTGNNQSCGDMKIDETEWAKWSPTKAKFENYVTASGAARMPLTTRNPQAKIIGTSNPLRSQPPVALSGKSITFNDADARLNTVFVATGVYPSTDMC